ncbi:MAG: hypothetical protein IPJ41_09950 [Phycisphaerales bacterium]|nr:hypothetical protein [Phycisphaerales bacterium]
MLPTLGLNEANAIPILAIGGGLGVAVISIVFGTIRSIAQTRSRETTKREIAAYIAEGSITPEDGEKLIKADMPVWERGRKC